jgi:HEAT repeat protein
MAATKARPNEAGLHDAVEVAGALNEILASATHDEFELGTDSAFAQALEETFSHYGSTALTELIVQLSAVATPTQVAVEALRTIAQTPSLATGQRREAIVGFLSHASYQVRDGATAALAALRDALAIPALSDAMAREPLLEVRREMERVIQKLRAA